MSLIYVVVILNRPDDNKKDEEEQELEKTAKVEVTILTVKCSVLKSKSHSLLWTNAAFFMVF